MLCEQCPVMLASYWNSNTTEPGAEKIIFSVNQNLQLRMLPIFSKNFLFRFRTAKNFLQARKWQSNQSWLKDSTHQNLIANWLIKVTSFCIIPIWCEMKVGWNESGKWFWGEMNAHWRIYTDDCVEDSPPAHHSRSLFLRNVKSCTKDETFTRGFFKKVPQTYAEQLLRLWYEIGTWPICKTNANERCFLCLYGIWAPKNKTVDFRDWLTTFKKLRNTRK